MKKLLFMLFSFCMILTATAQDVPNHMIPLGRGPGVIGWGGVASSTVPGAVLQNNVGADPSWSTGAATAFTPEAFGAVCDNSTDNSAAFKALGLAINAAGGGVVVEFARNCTYRVFNTLVPPIIEALWSVTDVEGLTVNCHGTTIATPYDFTGHTNTAIYMFIFTTSRGIVFNDCSFDQPNNRARGDGTNGTIGFFIRNGVTNVSINNLTMNGGKIGVGCSRLANEARSFNISVTINASNIFYPVTAEKTCDNLTTKINAVHPGRTFFITNIANVHAQIWSDASDSLNDVLINNSFDAADTGPSANVTRNVTINYVNESNSAAGVGVNSFITLEFQTSGGSAEGRNIMSDIDITATISSLGAAKNGSVLQIMNSTSTAKGRILNNVRLRGTSIMADSSGIAAELMFDKDWTGDFVYNLAIGPFFFNYPGTSAEFRVDGRGIAGPFTLQQHSATGITYASTNMATPVAAGYMFYDRVFLPTLITAP